MKICIADFCVLCMLGKSFTFAKDNFKIQKLWKG